MEELTKLGITTEDLVNAIVKKLDISTIEMHIVDRMMNVDNDRNIWELFQERIEHCIHSYIDRSYYTGEKMRMMINNRIRSLAEETIKLTITGLKLDIDLPEDACERIPQFNSVNSQAEYRPYKDANEFINDGGFNELILLENSVIVKATSADIEGVKYPNGSRSWECLLTSSKFYDPKTGLTSPCGVKL